MKDKIPNMTLEIVYTWQDGKKEVRYRKVKGSREADEMIKEVKKLQERLGKGCSYNYRFV